MIIVSKLPFSQSINELSMDISSQAAKAKSQLRKWESVQLSEFQFQRGLEANAIFSLLAVKTKKLYQPTTHLSQLVNHS